MMLRLGRGLQLAMVTPHEPSLDENPPRALSSLPPISSRAPHGPRQPEARRRESPCGLAYSAHRVGEVENGSIWKRASMPRTRQKWPNKKNAERTKCLRENKKACVFVQKLRIGTLIRLMYKCLVHVAQRHHLPGPCWYPTLPW